MDHSEAVRRGAAEKYLLDELLSADRDEFEQHFFDCQECAADLNGAAAFLHAAQIELKRSPVARAAQTEAKRSAMTLFRRPAFLARIHTSKIR
jgi:anti-sigma factor RsiW